MSYISAILVLGNTAEMYLHGTQMWFAAIGSSMAFAVSALLFVPLFYPLNITSSFQVKIYNIYKKYGIFFKISQDKKYIIIFIIYNLSNISIQVY